MPCSVRGCIRNVVHGRGAPEGRPRSRLRLRPREVTWRPPAGPLAVDVTVTVTADDPLPDHSRTTVIEHARPTKTPEPVGDWLGRSPTAIPRESGLVTPRLRHQPLVAEAAGRAAEAVVVRHPRAVDAAVRHRRAAAAGRAAAAAARRHHRHPGAAAADAASAVRTSAASDGSHPSRPSCTRDAFHGTHARRRSSRAAVEAARAEQDDPLREEAAAERDDQPRRAAAAAVRQALAEPDGLQLAAAEAARAGSAAVVVAAAGGSGRPRAPDRHTHRARSCTQTRAAWAASAARGTRAPARGKLRVPRTLRPRRR